MGYELNMMITTLKVSWMHHLIGKSSHSLCNLAACSTDFPPTIAPVIIPGKLTNPITLPVHIVLSNFFFTNM